MADEERERERELETGGEETKRKKETGSGRMVKCQFGGGKQRKHRKERRR